MTSPRFWRFPATSSIPTALETRSPIFFPFREATTELPRCALLRGYRQCCLADSTFARWSSCKTQCASLRAFCCFCRSIENLDHTSHRYAQLFHFHYLLLLTSLGPDTE